MGSGSLQSTSLQSTSLQSSSFSSGGENTGIPGMSDSEKGLLGLLSWWMTMNFIGIIYALIMVDLRGGAGVFQTEGVASFTSRIGSAIVRILSLGVFATRPPPPFKSDENTSNDSQNGGSSQNNPNIVKYLFALIGFLFLGVLFPSNIVGTRENFIDLGELPDFSSKNKNKPGDIIENAKIGLAKIMAHPKSILLKEHENLIKNIKERNRQFKSSTESWEEKFEKNEDSDNYYKAKKGAFPGWVSIND